MVKYAVHHNADPGLMALTDKGLKLFIGSQPPVHLPEISGVITVGGGFKQRADVESGTAKLLHMGDPRRQPVEGTGCRICIVRGRFLFFLSVVFFWGA